MTIKELQGHACDLANMVGIDLESAIAKKIEVNRHRQWRQV
ncbi:MAG: hypothetical protein ACRDGG_04990 [Anaerolineae bacterium]